MARVQNTLIGRASGSVDGVTFLTIFRKNVMRAKMSHQTNPNSTAQQSQRFKYNTLKTLYDYGKSILDIGFRYYSINQTPWNAFMKYNSKTVFQNNGTAVPNVNMFNLSIARGVIERHRTGESNLFSNADAYQVFWFATVPYRGTPDDIAHVVVINLTKGLVFIDSSVTRKDEVVYIFSDVNLDPTDVSISYVFFQNPITNEVSDSVSEMVVVQD